MLLSELTGIKNIKTLSPKELIAYLENAEGTKLKKLGAGANGAAFTDGKVAFKFWHRDSAYEKFIKYAIEHQDNPAIPKIYSKIRTLPFEIETDGPGGVVKGLKYVKMELLQPLKTRHIRVLTEAGRKELDLTKEQDKVDVNRLGRVLSRKTIEATLMKLIEHIFVQQDMDFDEAKLDINPYDGIEHLFNPSFVNFLKTIQDIHSQMSGVDYDDVQASNLAVRPSTGDLVILDPMANIHDLEINQELWDK